MANFFLAHTEEPGKGNLSLREGTKQRTSDLDKSQKLQLQLLLSANNPQVTRTCRVMLKAI
jgi:hypothetical protein